MIPWKKVGPQKGDGVYRNREKSSQKYGTKTTEKGLIFNLKNMKINYRHNIFLLKFFSNFQCIKLSGYFNEAGSNLFRPRLLNDIFFSNFF